MRQSAHSRPLKKQSKLYMPKIEFTKKFRKEKKKWMKSGKDMRLLEEFIQTVYETWPPPIKYEPHLLAGTMEGIWDVHLRQNWILLLRFHAGTVYFLRMGTHAELGL